MSKLRWGVMSTARIGLEKVIPALQASARGEVVAIAAGRVLARVPGRPLPEREADSRPPDAEG